MTNYVSSALKNPGFETHYKMKCQNLSMENCDELFAELKKTYSNVSSRLLLVEENKKKRKNSMEDLLLIIVLLSSLNNNKQNNYIDPYLLESNTRRNDILPLLALLSPPVQSTNYVYPYNNLYG